MKVVSEPALCMDCGVDTAPCSNTRGCRHTGRWEWYVVRDEVWEKTGLTPGLFCRLAERNEFLCIGCLEKRLGRPLTKDDFDDVPLNEPDPWDTPRLAAAKLRTA